MKLIVEGTAQEVADWLRFLSLQPQQPGFINVPSFNVATCEHDYPSPWHGTAPPPCKKCGRNAQDFLPTYTTVMVKP